MIWLFANEKGTSLYGPWICAKLRAYALANEGPFLRRLKNSQTNDVDESTAEGLALAYKDNISDSSSMIQIEDVLKLLLIRNNTLDPIIVNKNVGTSSNFLGKPLEQSLRMLEVIIPNGLYPQRISLLRRGNIRIVLS